MTDKNLITALCDIFGFDPPEDFSPDWIEEGARPVAYPSEDRFDNVERDDDLRDDVEDEPDPMLKLPGAAPWDDDPREDHDPCGLAPGYVEEDDDELDDTECRFVSRRPTDFPRRKKKKRVRVQFEGMDVEEFGFNPNLLHRPELAFRDAPKPAHVYDGFSVRYDECRNAPQLGENVRRSFKLSHRMFKGRVARKWALKLRKWRQTSRFLGLYTSEDTHTIRRNRRWCTEALVWRLFVEDGVVHHNGELIQTRDRTDLFRLKTRQRIAQTRETPRNIVMVWNPIFGRFLPYKFKTETLRESYITPSARKKRRTFYVPPKLCWTNMRDDEGKVHVDREATEAKREFIASRKIRSIERRRERREVSVDDWVWAERCLTDEYTWNRYYLD